MMTFEIAIARVLDHEGGYVNDPRDPGGETKFGISKRSYPDLDIANLTRDAAVAIYKRDFWDRVHGDELHEDLAYQALDFAVNSGCDTALRYLQRAVGVADDGHFGSESIKALQSQPPAVTLLTYLALRLKFMTGLKNWPVAGKGWAVRIANNMIIAAEDLLS